MSVRRKRRKKRRRRSVQRKNRRKRRRRFPKRRRFKKALRSRRRSKKHPRRGRRKPALKRRSQRAISIGIELEAYSISIPEYRISRELHFPRRGAAERGERFTKDVSIGNEYNSRVFLTLREALFLLKNGLRKYIHFRSSAKDGDYHTLFLVGGWIDRFAGSHLHIAFAKKKFTYLHARRLARYLHSHLPFLIALTGNSPVWRDKINQVASNRLLRGTRK